MKTSEFFFSFFSSLNQYFPHIPYVASKKVKKSKKGQKIKNSKFYPDRKKNWKKIDEVLISIRRINIQKIRQIRDGRLVNSYKKLLLSASRRHLDYLESRYLIKRFGVIAVLKVCQEQRNDRSILIILLYYVNQFELRSKFLLILAAFFVF
jgi:hypothetical protein